jgi:hypothetical protein
MGELVEGRSSWVLLGGVLAEEALGDRYAVSVSSMVSGSMQG